MFDKEGMGTVVLKYFTNIFSQSNRDYSCVINLIEPVVSSSDIDVLLAAFSADEFCKAVFQMHSDKTPWPSGMNPVFFFPKILEYSLEIMFSLLANNGCSLLFP